MLPPLICSVSIVALPLFRKALLACVKGSTLYEYGKQHYENDQKKENLFGNTKLKIGSIKKSDRIVVKLAEYRKEMGKANWPHSQFVSDILRASYVCLTAKDVIETFRSLNTSEYFRVIRLKNKIGNNEAPYNLHVNLLFHPPELKDPILCEVQIYPHDVFEMQHQQHLLYQFKRAPSVRHLL